MIRPAHGWMPFSKSQAAATISQRRPPFASAGVGSHPVWGCATIYQNGKLTFRSF